LTGEELEAVTRELTGEEIEAVTGGLANRWLDWIADNFHFVKMEAKPEVIQC
jgi:hypothetical protein